MQQTSSRTGADIVAGRISVIIPVYNGERYITQAIDSVLAQGHPDLEVVVVDDGSTDGTAALVRAYRGRVVYVFQHNAGSSVARNNGCRLATGEFLAFLDADDLWVEDKLARQLQSFAGDPSLDLVWGRVREFRDGEEPRAARGRPMAAEHPGTVLIRRAAFQRTGGFSEEYQQAEVVDWLTRILRADLRQSMIEDVLLYRRLHDRNKGLQNPEAGRQYLQILKRHLDSRRK
jgi:glycosyltransferase involved in cell wall biosynthesis